MVSVAHQTSVNMKSNLFGVARIRRVPCSPGTAPTNDPRFQIVDSDNRWHSFQATESLVMSGMPVELTHAWPPYDDRLATVRQSHDEAVELGRPLVGKLHLGLKPIHLSLRSRRWLHSPVGTQFRLRKDLTDEPQNAPIRSCVLVLLHQPIV